MRTGDSAQAVERRINNVDIITGLIEVMGHLSNRTIIELTILRALQQNKQMGIIFSSK